MTNKEEDTNELLIKLLDIIGRIKYDGQIVISRDFNSEHLIVEIRWLLENKLTYSSIFTKEELLSARFPLLDMVIKDANDYVVNYQLNRLKDTDHD